MNRRQITSERSERATRAERGFRGPRERACKGVRGTKSPEQMNRRRQIWLAVIVLGHCPDSHRDPWALSLHKRHCPAPAPGPAGRASRDAFRPVGRVGRRRRAGAAGRPCGAHRAEPAGIVGGGRRRWRHRLGRRLWLGGSRERGESRARYPVQDRNASTALTSAAAGLLLEKGRLKLDDEIQTYVPAFPRNSGR